MTGYEKAKKAAEAIKAKNKVEIEVKEEEKKEAENALAEVQTNPVLMQLYKDNAKVGTANLGGQSPLLKEHKLGKRTTNQLADGSEPNVCWFFNQIMSVAIVNGGDLKPFIMYLTGTKLKKMWEFGKEASKYTNAKPVPIPMFAMRVKLTTEKQKTDYGPTWIINFEIMKDEKEFPIVVADPGVFTFLRDQVDSFEDTLASLIAVRSAEEGEESPPPPVDVENEEVPF